MLRFLVVLLVVLVEFLCSGCSAVREFVRGPDDPPAENVLYTDDAFLKLTQGKKMENLSRGYRDFSVALPPQVEPLPAGLASGWVSVEVRNGTLKDIAVALSAQLPGISVDVQLSDTERAKKLHTLSYSGPLGDLLAQLASMDDVWVRTAERAVLITDTRSVDVALPVFLDVFRGEVKGDPLSTEFKPVALRELLLSASQTIGVKVNVVSESSGYVQVEASPSAVEKFARFLEKEVRELSRFVSIQISIFQLTLSRQFHREFSMSKVADLMWNLQGSIQLGSVSTDSASNLTVGIASEKNTLKTFFNYLNTLGDVRILASPLLVVANGIPAQFEITKEVGWWEPGDVEEAYGIAGSQTYRYRQGKPTWKGQKVGLSIVARPKIVVGDDGEAVHLDLLLKDSDIYGYSRTNWQSLEDVAPVVLEKPLISEKKLFNRSVIRKDEYLIIAGLQGRKQDDSVVLHGISKKVDREESFLFVIISAGF